MRGIEIISVDFNNIEEASYTINAWIANTTRNQINSLFKGDKARGSKLLLANTINFRGKWKHQFNQTVLERFEVTETQFKPVPMMKNFVSLRTGDITFQNGFGARWVEIPYQGNEFAMIIVLPIQRHYLDTILRTMNANDFSAIFTKLDNSYKKLVHLSLPKFTIRSTFSLVNVLLKVNPNELHQNPDNNLLNV